MRWIVVALLALAVGASDSTAQEHPLEAAVDALGRNDFAAAAPLLEQALEEDVENVEARFNLAFAYSQIGRDDRAIAEYRRVLEIKPDLPPALANLGSLLLRNERFAEAVPPLDQIARARPDEFQAQFLAGHALLGAGRLGEAVARLDRALALNPDSTDARLERGRALAALGRYESAAADYLRASKADPQSRPRLLELGERIEASGDAKTALTLYRRYLETDPENSAVQEKVGLLLLRNGETEQGSALLERVVENSPSVASITALGEAYEKSDEAAKATQLWRHGVAAYPEDPVLRIKFAATLLREERIAEAASQYLEAVKLDADRVEAWNGLAFSLYKAENFEGSLRALEEARRRGEVKPANLFLQAVVEDKLQLHEQAKLSYEAFLATDPPLEDEVWKAQQRLKTIEKILSKR